MSTMIAGSNAALTAENPGLNQLLVGFGWKVIASRGPQAEPVAAAVLCSDDGKALSNEHMVFFNQLLSPDASTTHGQEIMGGEDQEQIDIQLGGVPEEVKKICFFAYVDPEVRGNDTFSSVRDVYIRVANERNNELVRFEIDPHTLSSVNALLFGELYRHNGGWKFRALGQGYTRGLSALARDLGIEL